nr:hypothetical protein [Tanacetum cinerariifolium]
MILESVECGPLLWPSIEENGVTRLKKYSEISTTEAIQADCDINATNIILQGLPSEQERECKLYGEFDKFAYRKGESLRDFYLRFSLLLNDMNIYNMKLEQFQPLPLILDNRGRRVIPFEHFINNDLEYLQGGASSRKYTTSVTKKKAADYGHIKWIEDLVPRAMWIQEPNYDRHAIWGVSQWGWRRQQFYGFAVNWESALDVYSKRRIIAVTELKIMEWHDYKHLDWISGYPLVSVEVLRYDKRSKSENMGIVPTEMELILELTQQGISHEVS